MHQEQIIGKLQGAQLKNRYTVGRYLDSGQNGKVYKVVDAKHPKAALVLKISENCKQFSVEIHQMKKIFQQNKLDGQSSTPEVIDYGLVNLVEEDKVEKMMAYVIMPRYGVNLDEYFVKIDQNFSRESILDLALRLLSILEDIHAAGYVYNDLKLDNIMVGFKDKLPKTTRPSQNAFSKVSIHLVDFGYSTKYMKDGKHIEKSEVKTFRGNMMFCSLNQLQFKTPSRRDDLISLCYLLSYLLNFGEINNMDLNSDIDPTEAFKYVKTVKKGHTLGDLCEKNAECL